MHMPKDDNRTKQFATIALNILMQLPDTVMLDSAPAGAPSVMFYAGPHASAACHADMAELVATNDEDIVLLEFDRAFHPILPAAITVFQLVGDGIEVHRNCRLWVDKDQSSRLLVPEGQDVGFAVHRSRLIGVEGVPFDDAPGYALGEVLLFRGIGLLQDDPSVRMNTLARKEAKKKRRH